jgi:hypothetical protein
MVRGQFNGNSRNDGNFSAALARAAGPMAEATWCAAEQFQTSTAPGKAGVSMLFSVNYFFHSTASILPPEQA